MNPLTKEEEKVLFPKAKKGDKEAQRRIVTSVINLVYKKAMAYRKYCFKLEFNDLVQYGYLGIYKAINSYKPGKVKFSTYLCASLKNIFRRALQEHNHIIRPPYTMQENYNKVRVYIEDFEIKKRRKPTKKELRKKFNKGAFREPYKICSVDLLLNYIHDSKKISIENKDTVNFLLDKLSEKKRRIIELRFGLNGNPQLTLAEVGRIFRISKERVRQIEESAKAEMKKGGIK